MAQSTRDVAPPSLSKRPPYDGESGPPASVLAARKQPEVTLLCRDKSLDVVGMGWDDLAHTHRRIVFFKILACCGTCYIFGGRVVRVFPVPCQSLFLRTGIASDGIVSEMGIEVSLWEKDNGF